MEWFGSKFVQKLNQIEPNAPLYQTTSILNNIEEIHQDLKQPQQSTTQNQKQNATRKRQ